MTIDTLAQLGVFAASATPLRTANGWSSEHVLNKLRALRGPGESYSDLLLRLVEEALGEL